MRIVVFILFLDCRSFCQILFYIALVTIFVAFTDVSKGLFFVHRLLVFVDVQLLDFG
jgi:hypothetical protein